MLKKVGWQQASCGYISAVTIRLRNNYSGPQLRLWAQVRVAKAHSNLSEPPRVPMITGTGHKPQQKGSLANVFASVATAVVKVFIPPSCSDAASQFQMHFSPSKKVDEEFGTTVPVTATSGRWNFKPRRIQFPNENCFDIARSTWLNTKPHAETFSSDEHC